MTDEQRVKEKWTDAECVKVAYYGFQIMRRRSKSRLSGFWLYSEDAWADAAKRLATPSA